MFYPVFPDKVRQTGYKLCACTLAASLLVLMILFCALYASEHTKNFLFAAFLFSLMAALLTWNALLWIRKFGSYVMIDPNEKLITLYSGNGKQVRTFAFSDIREVLAHDYSYNTFRHLTKKTRCICIVSSATSADVPYHSQGDQLNCNPNRIIFSYHQYAFDFLNDVLNANLVRRI